MIVIFRHLFLSSTARHNKTPYGKRCKLHNTGLHIRRKFLADINRMPCPVGLRKEQMDYRAHRPSDRDFSSLSSFSFSASSSRLPLLSDVLRFFLLARLSGTGELRGFLFGVDGAKSSSN